VTLSEKAEPPSAWISVNQSLPSVMSAPLHGGKIGAAKDTGFEGANKDVFGHGSTRKYTER
ncbi:MAG: hypothetical protein WCY26_11395, partial [Thiohalobacteraceae bacterium]